MYVVDMKIWFLFFQVGTPPNIQKPSLAIRHIHVGCTHACSYVHTHTRTHVYKYIGKYKRK